MPAHLQNQSERLINIYSLNTARKNDVVHNALHIASTHERDFDIMLHQEPWWGPISERDDLVGEARSAGWTVLLPVVRKLPVPRRHRVLAYIRQNTDLELVQRMDLIEDYDIQILDIKRHGALQRNVRIINIYNAPEGGEHFAVDYLRRLILDPEIPTVITGDWNLKHPMYRAMPADQHPNERAVQTSEWLTTNGFRLQNEWNQETWRKYGESQVSALDYTFRNNASDTSNILQNWSIEPDYNAGSDHYATFLTLGGGEEEITNISEAKYNWKGVDKNLFTDRVDRELHEDVEKHNTIFGTLMNTTPMPTRTEVDAATYFMLECMTTAAEVATPWRRTSPRAKPWWTQKLSQARKDLNDARAEASAAHQLTGEPDPEAAQHVRHLTAVADRLYKKTKRDYYTELIRKTTPQNFWELMKWTRGNRQYPSPLIQRGAGREPA